MEESKVSSQEPTVSSSTSFTKVKTTSSSQTSSTSSESNYNINNRLDELASNLDPWAHIQHAEHKENELEKKTSTKAPTKSTRAPTSKTTTRASLNLFTKRPPPPTPPTRSTTTFKPRSLEDLFTHRNGGEKTSPPTSQTPEKSTTGRRISSARNQFRPKRPLKESPKSSSNLREEQDDEASDGRKVPETNRISTSFKDRFKLKDIPIKNDDVSSLLPADFKAPKRTTGAPADGGDALLRELLSNLKSSDLKQLLPETYGKVEDKLPSRKPSSSGGDALLRELLSNL